MKHEARRTETSASLLCAFRAGSIGKARQEEMQRVLRKSYNRKYLDYVCVDAVGDILKPQYVSEHFKVILERNGLWYNKNAVTRRVTNFHARLVDKYHTKAV